MITPMHRQTFDKNGKIANSHGEYPEAVHRVAMVENVPFIDLHAMSKQFYEAQGPEDSVAAFSSAKDGTVSFFGIATLSYVADIFQNRG